MQHDMYYALVWRLTWSSNGYRGWDHFTYKEWLYGKRPGFGYVKDYGFGHEWWNFYEGFSDGYYYGYAPPIHFRRPKRFINGGVIFYITNPPLSTQWYLVGVYGQAVILEKPEFNVVLWDLVPDDFKNEILDVTAKQLKGLEYEPLPSPTYFIIKARKEYSTPMPRPMPISLQKDIGVKMLGSAMYMYLSYKDALNLLDKAIDFIEKVKAVSQLE